MKAEAAIRELIEKRADAFRAKDVEGVFACQSEDIVQFILAPPLKCAGKTAFDREGVKEWFASFTGGLGYEIRELEITATEEIAFAHSLNHLSGTGLDGKEARLWFRDTLCFRKIDGEWKIIHEHSSVPFYMDGSLKAAIDLEP